MIEFFMKTVKIFDVIVIGAGAGGLNIANFMNHIGLKVLLIDKSDKNIGGDCLNYGCVPSKSLIHVARTIHAGRTSEAFGLHVSGDIDMEKVRQFVDHGRKIIRVHENADHFRKQGMEVVLGEAKLSGKNAVMVEGVKYEEKKSLSLPDHGRASLRFPEARTPLSIPMNLFLIYLPFRSA
jgi:pyruvate/2-oxoglutarate dehydrogenase complex dihydrolipoamide dehydrogenase (E3) component